MTCGLCGAWPDYMHHDESTNSSATDDRFPPEVDKLVDVRAIGMTRAKIKRCPECGMYYELDNYYEYTPLGNDDDFFLTRLTYKFPSTPARENRKRIEAMFAGIDDPVAAWATFTKTWQTPPRWKYVDGDALSPTPPTMKHVIAFGSDIWGMRRVDNAVQKLFAVQPAMEWSLTGAPHDDVIPRFMTDVLEDLREALHDRTIPILGVHPGWFERCARAWSLAWAKKIEPMVSRQDPFELLADIMRAGYRIEVKGQVIRVSCAE